jgi:mannose-6-phosphate isomerase-like protein (cupin superfamily)
MSPRPGPVDELAVASAAPPDRVEPAKIPSVRSEEYNMESNDMMLATRRIAAAPDVTAPDGSEVRVLCGTARGGMAMFTLPAKAVSKAIVHRTVDEVWYFISGRGRVWRRLNDEEVIDEVEAGMSVALPVGTHFQFRAGDAEPLVILGATMPPWPGMDEAVFVEGVWKATA